MSIRTCVLALVSAFALLVAALAPTAGAAFTPGGFVSHSHSKDRPHPKEYRQLPR
jgi:hypothetical protein